MPKPPAGRKLLARQGVLIAYPTLHRFAVLELQFGRTATTIPVLDVEPGSELQIDTGWVGWLTLSVIRNCEPVITAWGFQYKAHMIWNKVRGVCGSYVNVQHELLLICTRGSCTPDRLTPAISSAQIIQKSRVHSQKPDQFYELIEWLYDGPYLELFARRPRAGWTSFGNDPALSEVA